MDYTILLISDAYLKSSNCMYEVFEVMRDRRYKDKTFLAVYLHRYIQTDKESGICKVLAGKIPGAEGCDTGD